MHIIVIYIILLIIQSQAISKQSTSLQPVKKLWFGFIYTLNPSYLVINFPLLSMYLPNTFFYFNDEFTSQINYSDIITD